MTQRYEVLNTKLEEQTTRYGVEAGRLILGGSWLWNIKLGIKLMNFDSIKKEIDESYIQGDITLDEVIDLNQYISSSASYLQCLRDNKTIEEMKTFINNN